MPRFSEGSRRMFRGVVVASLVAVTPIFAAATTTRSASADSVEKPNVVVFLLDDAAAADQRYLSGIRQALGSEGLTFTRAIAQNPLCCPARAQLMTGQLSHNNGVLTNNGAFGGITVMVEPDNTIAAWMHDAGYQTSFAGKYIHGYVPNTDLFGPDGIPTGWDHWDATLRGAVSYWHFSTFADCPTLGDTACNDQAQAGGATRRPLRRPRPWQ
jgi:arylsulfatase A-like enzyme